MTTTVALVALVALLATAYLHPRARVEALVAVLAAGAALATGLLSGREARTTVLDLLPVVVFLATILVVADVCARAGVFAAAAHAIGRRAGGRADRLLLGVFLLAALVTAVLSLDATVVLLTPVVIGAAATLGTSTRPGAYACLRMANSASLLLPVSNLTNLLALPHLDLTFAGFAARMGPVLLVVLVVEYAVLRLLFRRELRRSTPAPKTSGTAEGQPAPPLARVPLVVVALMLVGFAVASPFGVEPAWLSGAAALVLLAWAHRTGLVGWRDAAQAAHPSFALFVLALGLVVAALATGFLGDLAAHLLPGPDAQPTYVVLLGIALVATLAANLLTNLSATLLVVPIVAPLGTTAVLAALLGLNIGSGLTYTGSLANLLWRRGLPADDRPSLLDFHRVAVVVTPLSLVAAVTTLALLS